MSASLHALSPLDGRYASATQSLSPYFSEYGLIHYRVRVEIEYLIALTAVLPDLKKFPTDKIAALRSIYKNFSEADALTVKEIEKTTNHDVKAVEYFIKKKFDELGLPAFKEFIHFGLTSQDVNNTAIPLSVKEALDAVLLPGFTNIITTLNKLAGDWKDMAMLARTHGQPASPTRLGKEIQVFAVRLQKQVEY
ncbi:MAG: hypothetical protein HKUEN01_32410 [Candidatus Kuenenia stuttgartiensis]|nr:MAG: hypothetical protein HKUEN01_32410 [Candidatus Kuenenia stuttgartiensis]